MVGGSAGRNDRARRAAGSVAPSRPPNIVLVLLGMVRMMFRIALAPVGPSIKLVAETRDCPEFARE